MCDSCISVFLAKVMGIFLFLVSLGMLVHQQRYKRLMHDFLSNSSLVNFSGCVGLILGLLVLGCHNVWVSDWPVLVTIIGWIVLLQGVMRIFFPDAYSKMVKELMNGTGYQVWSWVWLLIGLYLVWVGFSANA